MQPEGQATAPSPDFLCWLASFPRSGNTWVRNIFYEVFGLKSAEWGFHENGDVINPDCFSKPVVKTHLLPRQLIHDGADKKAVYLVRDGRDAMVSIAHHRSDIVAPGSDLIGNMRAAILAEKGSFFGGWSVNVEQWLQRADSIVRYEDLLMNPRQTVERLRQFLRLPEPDYDKMPRFEAMKSGLPQYGAESPEKPEADRRDHSQKFFRRGTSGAWRDEMPPDLHDLFWSIHGDTMLKLGYGYDGDMETTPDPDLDWDIARLTDQPAATPAKKFQVTIVVGKLFPPADDAVKRCVTPLLKQLAHVQRNPNARWSFNLYAKGRAMPLTEAWEELTGGSNGTDEAGVVSDNTAKTQRGLPGQVHKGLNQTLAKCGPGFIRRLSSLFHGAAHRLKTTIRPDQARLGPDTQLIHLPLQDEHSPVADAQTPVVLTIQYVSQPLRPPLTAGADLRKTATGQRAFSLRKAASLIVPSEAAAADLQRIDGKPGPPSFVIPTSTDRTRFHLKVNENDRRSACRRYAIPEKKPFFLTCPTLEWEYQQIIVAAFLELLERNPDADIMLVVGGCGPPYPLELRGIDPGKICITGHIQERDLPFILTESLAFCHLNQDQKFGSPLLEALNCGTPVIYGNSGSMSKMVGEAGLAVSPSDPGEISLQMEMVLKDEKLRQRLRHAALRQAAMFSSRKMARQTMDCYLTTLSRCRDL